MRRCLDNCAETVCQRICGSTNHLLPSNRKQCQLETGNDMSRVLKAIGTLCEMSLPAPLSLARKIGSTNGPLSPAPLPLRQDVREQGASSPLPSPPVEEREVPRKRSDHLLTQWQRSPALSPSGRERVPSRRGRGWSGSKRELPVRAFPGRNFAVRVGRHSFSPGLRRCCL